MKALFYSLHAAIWRHAAVENRLVSELTKRGCETVYVTCGGTFPEHCTSYSAEGVGLEAPRKAKDRICQTCRCNARLLAAGNKARHLNLRDFVSEEDEHCIDTLMSTVVRENYMRFQHLDVDVGRITSYECFLLYKKMSEKLSEEEWTYYRVYLRNALQSLLGFAKIFAEERPDIVFFYSPQYGVNGVCAQYAAIHGARTYFIEGSASNAERYTALRVWDWEEHGLMNPALKHWPSVRNRIGTEDVRRVTGHFCELFDARSYAVYSAPAAGALNLRSRFQVPPAAKVLLATLSSFDEAYAAFVIGKFPSRKVHSPVYANQFEWIKDTIARLAGRKDICLIIRIHPRDYPNKRDSRQSEQAALWEGMFAQLPKNVRVNWPQDGVSLYDMLDQVDAVVTGWSATGTEAMVFGVPVVTYDRYLPSYPSDIHFSGETVEEYFENIDRAIKTSEEKIAFEGYRWLAASFSMGTVKLDPLNEQPQKILKSKLLPRFIEKRIRLIIEKKEKEKDVKGGFVTREEADRFFEMIKKGEKSLYESILRKRSVLGEASINKTIKDEIWSLFQRRKILTQGEK